MTSIAELENYTKGAVLSDCGRYRYLLERHWNGGGHAIGFIMLNPSTADAAVDDATIRRCVGFAHAWGYRTLYVANLMAWRATDPADLPSTKCEAMGPMRNWFLRRLALQCDKVVCAWGAKLPRFVDRGFLYRTLDEAADSLGYASGWCLGRTANGQPRHPLYVRADAELQEFRP